MGGGDTTIGGASGNSGIGSGVATGDATTGGCSCSTIVAGGVAGDSIATGACGSTIGAGDSTTGNGSGSGDASGDGATGNGNGSGDASGATGSAVAGAVGAGDCWLLVELPGKQALEKFPGPHTSTAAEAGGAAAR